MDVRSAVLSAAATLCACAASAVLVTPAGPAVASDVAEVPISAGWFAGDITVGPDGNIWFTEVQHGPVLTLGRIARVSTAAPNDIREFDLPQGDAPNAIAAGKDGNIWYLALTSMGSLIGRVSPSSPSTIEEFRIGGIANNSLAVDPAGDFWIGDGDSAAVLEVTVPAHGLTAILSGFDLPIPELTMTAGLTVGPHGSIWWIEMGCLRQLGTISSANPSSAGINEIALSPMEPCDSSAFTAAGGITMGPDGDMWFTQYGTAGAQIGHVASSSPYQLLPPSVPLTNPGARLGAIITGADGALWFSEVLNFNGGIASSLGRMEVTPPYTITETTVPSGNPIRALVAGPDGSVWFTTYNTIGRQMPETEVPTPPATQPMPTATSTRTPHSTKCVGDCSGSGVVTISDLLLGVNIVLGQLEPRACPSFENAAGRVDIAQIIRAVNNVLNGC